MDMPPLSSQQPDEHLQAPGPGLPDAIAARLATGSVRDRDPARQAIRAEQSTRPISPRPVCGSRLTGESTPTECATATPWSICSATLGWELMGLRMRTLLELPGIERRACFAYRCMSVGSAFQWPVACRNNTLPPWTSC